MPCPDECKKHRDSSINYIKYYVIPRQELRLKYKGGSEKFEKEHWKLVMKEAEMSREGNRFGQFFECLNNAGLFDNLEEEMIQLGIGSKKEFDEHYGFFKEYKKGEPVTCPKCGLPMKRVEIIYNDHEDYADLIRGNSRDYLFANERFDDCPQYGYICNKCPEWYEEYASPDKDKIIIRNWCWGWHEFIYKPKALKSQQSGE